MISCLVTFGRKISLPRLTRPEKPNCAVSRRRYLIKLPKSCIDWFFLHPCIPSYQKLRKIQDKLSNVEPFRARTFIIPKHRISEISWHVWLYSWRGCPAPTLEMGSRCCMFSVVIRITVPTFTPLSWSVSLQHLLLRFRQTCIHMIVYHNGDKFSDRSLTSYSNFV